MKKKWMNVVLAGAIATAVFAGCGNKEETQGTPTPTPEVQATEAPQETLTPVPTVEPTATLTVTPTVAPTETPAPTVTDDIAETKVTLGQYKGLTLYEVDSKTVAAELHAILEEYTELVAVDRAAVPGDTVNINFVGKKDGVAFEGGTDDSEEGTNLGLGSGQFIDGFEEGLIGAVAGEVRDLNLTFPENYGNAELAGQAVVFTVTVNEVLEEVVPEPTDAFAQENLGYNTWSEYVSDLYAAMNRESYYTQITESIMASSMVENYPAEELALEKQRLYDYYYNNAQMYGMYFGVDAETALMYFWGFESLASLEKFAEEGSYEVVKNNLVLAEIAKTENLEMSEEDYQARVLQYAYAYGYETAEDFIAANDQDSIDKTILLEYVMDYLVSQSAIIEADYETVIQPE